MLGCAELKNPVTFITPGRLARPRNWAALAGVDANWGAVPNTAVGRPRGVLTGHNDTDVNWRPRPT